MRAFTNSFDFSHVGAIPLSLTLVRPPPSSSAVSMPSEPLHTFSVGRHVSTTASTGAATISTSNQRSTAPTCWSGIGSNAAPPLLDRRTLLSLLSARDRACLRRHCDQYLVGQIDVNSLFESLLTIFRSPAKVCTLFLRLDFLFLPFCVCVHVCLD